MCESCHEINRGGEGIEHSKDCPEAIEVEITLERDSCEKCQQYAKELLSGERWKPFYCSAWHSNELGKYRKKIVFEQKKKELFDMVSQWGRVGAKIDETAPQYKEMIDSIQEYYY